MILEIVKYGHPVLRSKCQPVVRIDSKLRELVKNMLDTMYDASGIGLAAPQVNVPMRLFVLDVIQMDERPSTMSMADQPVDLKDWMPMTVINPTLELFKTKKTDTEGCLSFPEVTADIVRPDKVITQCTLIDGKKIEFEASGLLARAIQHETDHLNGILFIDRMKASDKAQYIDHLRAMRQNFSPTPEQ